jgi:enoyl-CoA hydratase/carnithine racemase
VLLLVSDLGVVTKAADDPWEEARALARRIAKNGPLGVRGAKEVCVCV